MLIMALLLQSHIVPPIPAETESVVVVTGDNLEKTRRALDDCLARHCPPKEDITKSLAYAEMQFLNGDYPASYRTLLSARGRNARYDATWPREVADLHRATGRLAALNGVAINPRVNAADAVYALRAGLPANDPAIFEQRLAVGDELAREGRIEGALQHYDWVAREAQKAGQINLVGMSYVRTAVLLSALGSLYPEYRTRAREAVARILDRPEPEMLPYRNAARAIRIQLTDNGDQAAVAEKVIAEMEPGDTGRQTLVYAPAFRMEDFHFGAANGQEAAAYVDISFRVTADGHVTDIEPQQMSDIVSRQWVDVLTKALAERRYTPRLGTAGAEQGLRLERFSFVSPKVTTIRSRLPQRVPGRVINSVDLSPEATS